jgi:hypothetical protein
MELENIRKVKGSATVQTLVTKQSSFKIDSEHGGASEEISNEVL